MQKAESSISAKNRLKEENDDTEEGRSKKAKVCYPQVHELLGLRHGVQGFLQASGTIFKDESDKPLCDESSEDTCN